MSIIQAQGYYQHRYNTNSEGVSAVGCNLQFAPSVSLKRQSMSSSGDHTPPSSSLCSSFNYSPSSSIPRVNYGTFSPLTGTKFFACSVSELPYIVTTLVAYILDDGNSILLDMKISEFGWSCCDNDPKEASGTCKFAVTMHLDSAKDRVITKFRRLDGCAQTFTRVVQQFCEYRNVAGHARRVDAMTKVESCIVAIGGQIPATLPKPQSHSQPPPRLEHEQAVAFVPLKAAKSSLASSPKMLLTSDAGAGAAAATGSLVFLSSAHSSARACVTSCKMFANWMKSDPTEALQSLLKAMPKLWLDFVLSLDAPSLSSFEQPQQQLLLFSTISSSSSSGEPTLQELRNAMSALYAALCLVVAQCLHALQTSEQSARAAACAAASASPASVSVSVPAVASSSSDNKHWRTAAAVQRALEQQQQKQQQQHHEQQQGEEQGGAGFFCSYAEATAARDDTATVYRAISFAETSSSSFSSFSLPPSVPPFHQSSTAAGMETKFGNMHLHPATALGGKTTAAAACWAPAPMQATSAAVGAAQDGIEFVNLCDTDPRALPAYLLASVVPGETRAAPARRQQQQQQPLIPLSAEFTQRVQTSNGTHMLMQCALPDTSRVLFLALSCLAGFAQGGRGVLTPRSRSAPTLPPRVGSVGPSGPKIPAMPPRPAMLRRGTSMPVPPRAEEEQDPMFTPRQSEVIEELVVNLLLENAELKHAVLVLPDLLEALVHAPASSSSSSSASSAAPAPSAVPAMERDMYAALSVQSSCRACLSSPSISAFSHGSSGSSSSNIGGSGNGEACAGCYMCDHTRKNLALLREIECLLGC